MTCRNLVRLVLHIAICCVISSDVGHTIDGEDFTILGIRVQVWVVFAGVSAAHVGSVTRLLR